jgi:hypothetical protein
MPDQETVDDSSSDISFAGEGRDVLVETARATEGAAVQHSRKGTAEALRETA